MTTKSLPVRLDDDLYERLKELAEIEGSTMVDLVRRALRGFLPQLAAEHATRMEGRLERLRTFMRQHPDAVDQSLDDAARAESEAPDPLEGDLDTIRQMARVIVDRFDPRMVILFGSHARGTAGPESDVDLLVVMDLEDSRRRTGARIGAALHTFPVPKDIVVTTPEAFRTRRTVPGTIERSAAEEGVVLHGG